MTIDPLTATLDELRDWFAERDGWNRPDAAPDPTRYSLVEAAGDSLVRGRWWRRDKTGKYRTQFDHPYPPTRDGAAGAMPEGWFWTRDGAAVSHRPDGLLLKWTACQRGADNWRVVENPDTGNEIDDRYRLAALACLAMDAKEAQ